MKEIFKKTGWDKEKPPRYNVSDCKHIFSLADLLANKSWCKAVWGESEIKGDEILHFGCDYHSTYAFQTLQQQGEKECIKYIKETMI